MVLGAPGARQGVMRNFVFLMSSRAVQGVAGFFIAVAVARYLAVGDFGDYSFALALASSVTSLTYFGIQQVAIREMSRHREKAPEYFGIAVILRAGISLAVIACFSAALVFTDVSRGMATAVIIALISEVFLSFSMLHKAVFQAFEKMVYDPLLTVVYYISLSACIAAVILLDLGYMWLIAAAAAANLLQLIAAVYFALTKFVHPVFSVEKKILFDFFKHTAVVGFGIFFYQNLLKVNVLLLKWLSGSQEVGLFQVPHNLVMQLHFIPATLVAAMYPAISRSFHHNTGDAQEIYSRAFRYILLFSVLTSVYLSFFSTEIIETIFGAKFSKSAEALVVMSWAFIPLSLDVLLNSVLIALNKQRYNMIYGGAALAMNVLLGIVVIPVSSYIGASWLAVFSYTVLFLCSLYFVSRSGLSSVKLSCAAKAAGAGGAAAAAIYLLKPVSLLLAVPAGVSLYIFLILITGAFRMEEAAIIFRKLSSPRRSSENEP